MPPEPVDDLTVTRKHMSLSTYYITQVPGEARCLCVAALSKTAQTRPAQPRHALSIFRSRELI